MKKNLKALGVITLIGVLLTPTKVDAKPQSNPSQSQKEINIHAGATKYLLNVASKAMTEDKHYVIRYTNTNVNLREAKMVNSKKLTTLKLNTKVKCVKTNSKWLEVKYKNYNGYICSKYLSKKKTKVPKISKPHKEHLTRTNGVFYYRGRRESYYNLPMGQVVRNMNRMGFHGSYSVRYDGVKLFNGYVIVAGDLSAYPRGSLIETSLGTGIICDTGTFVKIYGSRALDIATTW